MDKESDSSAGNMRNGQQGIFSTPELTVDTEKIAADTEAAAETSRAKIASIFANTETGKQAQRLNDAMGVNTIPTTEDIVIDNGVRKKKKWPIVVAAVTLVLAAAGVGGWFLTQNFDKQPKETPFTAFNSYREDLIKGSESLRGEDDIRDTNDWFIFQIMNNASFSNTEIDTYLAELNAKYNNFSTILDTTPYKNDLDVNFDRYHRLLELFTKGASLPALRQAVLDKYLDDDASVAYSYIAEISPVQPSNEEYRSMSIVSNAVKGYLEAELSLIEIYDDLGCIHDHILDTACGEELADGNTALIELVDQQASAQQRVTGYLQSLQTLFVEMTNNISKSLEEHDV